MRHVPFSFIRDNPEYKTFKSFVILRDPFDRLVSAYLDKLVYSRKRYSTPWIETHWGKVARSIKPSGSITFAEFVEFVNPSSDDPYRADQHWASQCSRLSNYSFDFYLDFASLASEMERFCVACGIPSENQHLPHFNAVGHLTNKPEDISPEPVYDLPNDHLAGIPYISVDQFHSEKLQAVVRQKYSDDYLAYHSRFGKAATVDI